MGQDARSIENEIRTERQDPGRNIDQFQRQVNAPTDWRSLYGNHAGATLAIAFGGGVALGLLARRMHGPAPASDRPPGWEPARPVGFNPLKAIGENPKVQQQVGQVWDDILEVLISVASAKAIEVLGSFVPGFQDEYDARHSRRPDDRIGEKSQSL